MLLSHLVPPLLPTYFPPPSNPHPHVQNTGLKKKKNRLGEGMGVDRRERESQLHTSRGVLLGMAPGAGQLAEVLLAPERDSGMYWHAQIWSFISVP